MKYEIIMTSQFKKDYKLTVKRGYNINLLKEIIRLLAEGKPLPEKKQRPRPDRKLEALP